jgi:hypothetical protein
MKNIIILFILYLLSVSALAQKDSVYIRIEKDTIKVWNINLIENCGSKFQFEISYQKDTIIIIEADTSLNWYKCLCDFNLSASITGLTQGKYFVKVYRRYKLLSQNEDKFVGTTWFEYSPSQSLKYSDMGYQSKCLSNLSTGEKKEVRGFNLQNNYPNPFNSSTQIKYELQFEGNVVLDVYDLTGRKISTLVNKKQKPGNYEETFNPLNLTTGMYIYRLRAGENQIEKKMILLK